MTTIKKGYNEFKKENFKLLDQQVYSMYFLGEFQGYCYKVKVKQLQVSKRKGKTELREVTLKETSFRLFNRGNVSWSEWKENAIAETKELNEINKAWKESQQKVV